MPPRSYTLNLLGDVMLGRLIDQLCTHHVHEPSEAAIARSFINSNPHLGKYGPESPWGDVLPLLEEADLNIINLETAVTTHPTKFPNKVFNYRMHPKNIEILHAAGIDYAGLANNHTLDFGEPGLEETLRTVKEAGIAFAGAGHDREEAARPEILHLDSHKVCIWAASDHPQEWSQIPTFHFFDYTQATKSRLKTLLRETSPPDTSLKIFSCHWGPNYSWHPSDDIRDLAHFLIDKCDIDIVHGHSSHHVQGVEVYNQKLIIYGCGDFVDDYALVQEYRNDLGAVWRVSVEEGEGGGRLRVKRLEVFPTKIEKFAARRLGTEEDDAEWIRETVGRLSRELGTKSVVEDGGEGRVVIEVA